MRKIILSALLIFGSLPAYAELSTNPWQTANDEEAVQQVYQKRIRRGKQGAATEQYVAEESTVIDRTHAYIQDEDLPAEEEDTGFLGKVKNIVSPKPQNEGKLIANTAENRRKIAEQKRAQEAQKQEKEDNSGILPSLGGLTNSFKLPNVNAVGMIQKFEKASGINLKSIGKQFK